MNRLKLTGYYATLLPAMALAASPPPQASAPQAPSVPPIVATTPQTAHHPAIVNTPQAGKGGQAPDAQNPPAPKKPEEKRTRPAKNAKPASSAAAEKPAATRTGETDAFSARPPERGIRIYHSSGEARLEPLLTRAYQAFMTGDVDQAKTDYLTVLRQAPGSRDALLGLAAIAANRGQTQDAISQYQRVLHFDPMDIVARTALIVLGGDSDPDLNESALKTLLAQAPDAGFVHFALGNLYARQSRWSEAQEAYFKALHATPDSADCAFNLAVSLDHLDQSKSALAYYRHALTLHHGNFDREQLKKRIEELQAREP